MVMSRSKNARIDKELDEVIKDYAEKNECSFRQASKELAKITRVRLAKNNILKEIKF